jgi:hypothetical protein
VQVVAPAPAEPDTVGGPEVWPQASGLPDQINNGAPAAAWPQTNVNVAPDNTSGPQLPVPSVQDFGISLQGQMLLGVALGLRSSLDVPSDYGGFRHEQLRSHRRRADTNGRRHHAAIRPRAALLPPSPPGRLGTTKAIRRTPAHAAVDNRSAERSRDTTRK